MLKRSNDDVELNMFKRDCRVLSEMHKRADTHGRSVKKELTIVTFSKLL